MGSHLDERDFFCPSKINVHENGQIEKKILLQKCIERSDSNKKNNIRNVFRNFNKFTIENGFLLLVNVKNLV